MEEVPSTDNSKAVVGASSATRQESSQPMNPLDKSDLPMIVWLKGDEPYVEDFSVDADAAMTALGIKRSRLTQISGRELRVGRIRIDRYTRPVYRPEDIEIYKQWTRPTATHLRSSSVITDAAKKLEQHTEQITQELKEGLNDQVEELIGALAEVRQEGKDHLAEYLLQTRNMAEDLKLRFFEQSSRNNEDLRERVDGLSHELDRLQQRMQELTELEEKLDQLQQGQTHQGKQVEVVVQALAQLTEYLGGFIEQQTSTNRDMGKALSLLIQFVRDSSRKQEQILQALPHTTEPIVAAPPAGATTPPRRLARQNPGHYSRRRLFK